MGLFDDANEDFYFKKEFTYEDVIRMLEDIFAEGKQKDT